MSAVILARIAGISGNSARLTLPEMTFFLLPVFLNFYCSTTCISYCFASRACRPTCGPNFGLVYCPCLQKYKSLPMRALLVYKYLQSSNSEYFEPFLMPGHSVYKTCRSQSDSVMLKVSYFASIYNCEKHMML